MYFVLPFRFLASFFVSYPCKLFETWNEWVKNIKNNTSSKIFFITFSFHPIWIIVNLDRKYFSSFCYDIGYGMIFLIWDIQSIFFLIFPPSKWTFFSMLEAVSCFVKQFAHFYAFIPHSISAHTFDRNRINRFDDTRLIQKWTGEEYWMTLYLWMPPSYLWFKIALWQWIVTKLDSILIYLIYKWIISEWHFNKNYF